MSLPYTYKSKIEIPGTEIFSIDEVYETLSKELYNNRLIQDYKTERGKIYFFYHALFSIKYPIEITIEKEGAVNVLYEAKLMKLIQLSIALVVFTAFFSSFGISGFLWFSAIFTLVFFSINVLFIESGIQKMIKSTVFYQNLNPGTEGQFSEEQQKWMKDTNKCPACGESIRLYEQNCPECGLTLPRKPIAKPFDVSKYDNKRLNYFYKEKKSEDES